MRVDSTPSLGPCPTCRGWVIRATLHEESDPGRTADELALWPCGCRITGTDARTAYDEIRRQT